MLLNYPFFSHLTYEFFVKKIFSPKCEKKSQLTPRQRRAEKKLSSMKSSNFICTINTFNSTIERIERLIWRGMTVARINLSHSNENENLSVIRNIRYAAENVSNRIGYYLPLGIALDLRGAEIRITKIGKQFNPKLSEGDVNIKFSCDEKYKDMEPLDLAYVPCNAISRFLKKGLLFFY